MLILIFSVMLYRYIKITIFESSIKSTVAVTNQLASKENLENANIWELFPNLKNEYEITIKQENITKTKIENLQNNDKYLLVITTPYNKNSALVVKKDITIYNEIVKQILINIIIVNAIMIFLILFYALFLSRIILLPIKTLSLKISKLNENELDLVKNDEIETEFMPLAETINQLINRLKNYVLYQKELFIGAAHELKTPLAVMKAKNEVTLIKNRDNEKYKEALRINIEEINNMNKMITSILEIGRQESAQFENSEQRDIITYLGEICLNFKSIAKNENKDIRAFLTPNELFVWIQPTLFLHIIQNFIQNAIKFAKDGSIVEIKSQILDNNFIIEIFNEGENIDENINYFAPFKRFGGKQGAGLGLFLAKNAAMAMGAQIELKNKIDGEKNGVVAIFTLSLEKIKVKKVK